MAKKSFIAYNSYIILILTRREGMGVSTKFVSLITDFGNRDGFVGIMKGVMLKINPNLQFIDISHEVKSFDLFNGAFLVERSLNYLPENAIHLVIVDPGVGSSRIPIIVSTKLGQKPLQKQAPLLLKLKF